MYKKPDSDLFHKMYQIQIVLASDHTFHFVLGPQSNLAVSLTLQNLYYFTTIKFWKLSF